MTPGSRINQQFVERDIVAACYEHDISQVGFDPWNAEALITNLKNHGLWPYEVRQGFASLSEPSKHLEASVAEGSFRHGGNPIASWNAENIEIQSDVNGNIRPVKSVQSNKRIDGIVAAIIAIGVAIVTGDDEVRSVYETPGSFCP
jgi:phage terminase large subunit-like protein